MAFDGSTALRILLILAVFCLTVSCEEIGTNTIIEPVSKSGLADDEGRLNPVTPSSNKGSTMVKNEMRGPNTLESFPPCTDEQNRETCAKFCFSQKPEIVNENPGQDRSTVLANQKDRMCRVIVEEDVLEMSACDCPLEHTVMPPPDCQKLVVPSTDKRLNNCMEICESLVKNKDKENKFSTSAFWCPTPSSGNKSIPPATCVCQLSLEGSQNEPKVNWIGYGQSVIPQLVTPVG